VHDFNGGIQPSRLFWVVDLPDGAFQVSNDGRRASMHASNVAVIDSFQFGSPDGVPASVNFTVEWQATGPFVRHGNGNHVPPTDPGAFLGDFAPAFARGSLSGRELGFSFKSNPGVTTQRGFAEMGRERNGSFL
jgi:hypothetical protein